MNKMIQILVALMLAWALSPVCAFADEVQDAGFDVIVSDDAKAAKIEGATFAVDGFSRAEKGSSNERGGMDIGYNYYTGDSADACVALVFAEGVICYVPESAHALCDISDATSKAQLQAYLMALDAAADKGSGAIAQGLPWTFTSNKQATFAGLEISFAIDAGGRFYTGMQAPGGAEADWTEMRPDHADIVDITEPGAVSVSEPATGFAAFAQFLSGIDMSPLWVTLKTTGCAIVIIFVLGLAAAYFTMRIPKRAQDIFDTIFTIPMVLPPTVCGFILLLCLGRNTALGQWFIDIGFPLIFSWPATVIAATVVAFPLMYRSSRGAFENLDPNMLDAARTLGWSDAKIFFRLMIPLTWSSIAAATVLAFARALGEFGATLFLAGNYVGITRTIPIAIYFEWMSGNTDVAIFWTVIILLFSFAVILFINLWGRHTTKYRERGDA
ncbi:MAG: molybdate ABC transporter permease subunit [Eggerthellaceae bacterium]|nr:molybdate ABC transporter permease subunit [Eggerthellaceae bacterium]